MTALQPDGNTSMLDHESHSAPCTLKLNCWQ